MVVRARPRKADVNIMMSGNEMVKMSLGFKNGLSNSSLRGTVFITFAHYSMTMTPSYLMTIIFYRESCDWRYQGSSISQQGRGNLRWFPQDLTVLLYWVFFLKCRPGTVSPIPNHYASRVVASAADMEALVRNDEHL